MDNLFLAASRNIPAFLYKRQFGFTNPNRFRSNLYKLKLRQLHCTSTAIAGVGGNWDRSIRCSVVCPANGSFICAWIIGDYPRQLAVLGKLNENPRKDIVPVEASNSDHPVHLKKVQTFYIFGNTRIIDIIYLNNRGSPLDSLLIFREDLSSSCSYIDVMSIDLQTTQPLFRPVVMRTLRLIDQDTYSIVWNSNTQKVSLGMDIGCVISTLDLLFEDIYDVACPGGDPERLTMPYAQQFNSNGSLLYAGFHDGHVQCCDRRSNETRTDIVIGDAVTSIRILKDDVTLIVGGKHDKLCCADVRMNSVLFDYPGHQTKGRKSEMYLNELFGLLCSTGGDYVTRYWDIKCGDLLTESPENFADEEGLYTYSTIQSSGKKFYSYSFCNNKICYKETFDDYLSL